MKEHKGIFTLYSSEQGVYAEYNGKDAEEIIFPEEIPHEATQSSQAERPAAIIRLFGLFLDFCENLGSFYSGIFRAVLFKLMPLLLLPRKLASRLRRIIKKLIADFGDKQLRRRLNPPDKLREDLKNIRLMSLKQDEESKSVFFIKATRKYFSEYFLTREKLLKGAVNYGLPLAVSALIILCIFLPNHKVAALRIMHKGETIAYAENQEIFREGKDMALALLHGEKDNTAELLEDITLGIERVDAASLSSAAVICESLLRSNASEYDRACGIYVDGELLCAVKNESDAAAVFDSILAPYEKKADDNTIVAFVEEIEYVQLYYPQSSNIILDSAQLLEMLSAKDSPVRVKTMKTVTKYETLKHDTIKKNTSTLYKGTKKTTQKGKDGKALVTEIITYIDSKKTYTATVSEKVITKPTDEIVLIGTKGSSSSPSYSSSKEFIWPTRGAYSVSSHYGYRSASISGWSYHGGIDIVLGSGSSSGIPVVASAAGTVVTAYSGWSGYGHTVVIDHGGGIQTRYAHMYPGSITVRPGDRVYQGQQIGRIGATGNSTGPHLHFEVLVNGYKVNPYPYIR